MEFSNWLTFIELKNIISETYHEYLFNNLLMEISQTKGSIENLLENDENDDDSPISLNPFSDDEDAKPVGGETSAGDENEEALRHNLRLLDELDIDDHEDRKTIIQVLIELGYIEKPASGEPKRIKSSKVNELYNKAKKDYASMLSDIRGEDKVVSPDLGGLPNRSGSQSPPQTQIADLENKLLQDVKDAMLRLRYKAMDQRKTRIDQLKTYKDNFDQNIDKIRTLLAELGYIDISKTYENEDLLKRFNNATKEDGNEVPSNMESEISGSIDHFTKDFMEKFGKLWTNKVLPEPLLPEFLDEKLVKQIKNRFVSETTGRSHNWAISFLPPNKSQYKIGDSGEKLTVSRLSGIQNNLQKHMAINAIRSNRERTFGVSKSDDEGGSWGVENIPSKEEPGEISAAQVDMEHKIKQIIINMLNDPDPRSSLDSHIFFTMLGTNWDEVLSGSSEPLTYAPLRKNKSMGLLDSPMKQTIKKLSRKFPNISTISQTSFTNGLYRGAQIFGNKICSDPDLKNSRMGNLDLQQFCGSGGVASILTKLDTKEEEDDDRPARSYKDRIPTKCTSCGEQIKFDKAKKEWISSFGRKVYSTNSKSGGYKKSAVDSGLAKCARCGGRVEQIQENFKPYEWQKIMN